MDTKKKIFFMSALALLACSCQEDKMTGISGTAAPGVEVNFGGMLGDGETRTIYGPEANDAFPIYWVKGDKVLVASPDCANSNGVGLAEYAISVDNAEQNYATSMDKTGEIGVRWGENTTGTFYSIYPAAEHTRFNAGLTSARFTVTTQQDNTWNPADNTVMPDMSACFMWAKTEGVAAGQKVNLAYKPLSTAVRFTVTGPMEGSDPITISYIRLYAPDGTALSGTFDVDFTKVDTNGMPTVTAVEGETFNYASMNAATGIGGSYLTLSSGKTAEVQLFFMLENEVTLDENWSIKIATYDGQIFTKSLSDAAGQTLKPGQIHKLPAMPPLSQNANWDPSDWMSNIQRNVYLSEISIPGSWNSLNPDFQGTSTIEGIQEQYNAGVRAFHLDTRWIAAWRLFTYECTGELGIANGGATYPLVGGSDSKYMQEGECPTFAAALNEITSIVQDDEYMLVYCTFAQGSANPDGYDWRVEINEACQANADKIVYAHELSAKSTVADVLGRVIVIVSTYTPAAVTAAYPFFTDLRNELDATEFTTSPYFVKDLTLDNSTPSDIDIYATYAQITNNGSGTGTTGGRGYEPTLAEREQKCNNLLNWSQSNYIDGAFEHNKWIFMGLGGYVDDRGEDYNAVSNRLVVWLNGKLSSMETDGVYYPVGIVFMNNVLNNRSGLSVDITQTMKDILLLNNRYRKAYDPDRSPVDGSPIGEGGSTVKSAAPGYSSGMVDNREDAIRW